MTATGACGACRSSKRRCDRQRPRCALCTKKNLQCTYAQQTPESLPDHHDIPSPRDQEQKSIPIVTYFLDSGLFSTLELKLQPDNSSFSTQFLDLVDDKDAVHSIATAYFQTTHQWLPIISKQRFYQCLLNPLSGMTTDFILILVSMKLITSSCDETSLELHESVKKAFLDSVSRGNLSLCALQAGILITLFEVGHALYPAAFLSVGFCARLGVALKVDDTLNSDSGRWADVEEARRVWWSILILDRFTAFGSPQRPLATRTPDLMSILPRDDRLWDRMGSDVHRMNRYQLGAASTLQLGRFGRFAQSTRLLSQTLDFLSSSAPESPESTEQAEQLCRTLLALCHINNLEESERRIEFCTQTAVLYSAILLLSKHDCLDHIEPGADEYPAKVLRVEDALTSIQDMLPRLLQAAPERISPFLVHAIYKAGTYYVDSHQFPSTITNLERFRKLKTTLEHVNMHWQSAGAYLSLIKAVEGTTVNVA